MESIEKKVLLIEKAMTGVMVFVVGLGAVLMFWGNFVDGEWGRKMVGMGAAVTVCYMLMLVPMGQLDELKGMLRGMRESEESGKSGKTEEFELMPVS